MGRVGAMYMRYLQSYVPIYLSMCIYRTRVSTPIFLFSFPFPDSPFGLPGRYVGKISTAWKLLPLISLLIHDGTYVVQVVRGGLDRPFSPKKKSCTLLGGF